MSIYLNERYSGGEHVTAKDEAAVKGAIVGEQNAVIDCGNNFAATVAPGTGQVTISDGVFCLNGRCGWSDGGTVAFTSATGDTVYKKVIIGILYERDSATNVETVSFAAYESDEKVSEEGAAAATISTPSAFITAQETTAFFPLWQFIVTATTATEPEQRFKKVKNLAQLTAAVAQEITDRQGAISTLTSSLNSQASAISAESSARSALDTRVQKIETVRTKRFATGQSITGNGVNIATTGTPMAFTIAVAWSGKSYQLTQVGTPIKLNGASILPAIFELTKKDGVSAEVVKIEISMSTSNDQATINVKSESSDVYLLGANIMGVSGVS